MDSRSKPNILFALLSATGATGMQNSENVSNIGLLSLSGIPFVEYQINQLARLGITSILLEIDSLPGALVKIAESAEKRGISVEFVRSPAELKSKLAAGQFMFIMSEGVYVDDQLLAEIVNQQSSFIATLDGRDENSGFERIDLNSFWSGVAMLGAQSVEAIAVLPEGWSIGSSLLRRALQDSIAHRPLKQELIDTHKLRKVQSQADVLALSQQLLRSQAREVEGGIERFIFASISTSAVASIWKFPLGKLVFNGIALALFFFVLICAYLGFGTISSAAGFAALWTIHIRSLLTLPDKNRSHESFISMAQWGALGAALTTVLLSLSADIATNLFVTAMTVGLLFLSFNLNLPAWGKAALRSPAAFNLVLFAVLLIGGGIKWIMCVALVQLGAIIIAQKSMKRNVHG